MESEIDLQALRSIALSLIDSAAQALGSNVVSVDSETDFYWEVPLESQFAIKSGTPTLDVGRLSDDWGFIKAVASDPNSSIPMNLLHLAPILTYLALCVTQRK